MQLSFRVRFFNKFCDILRSNVLSVVNIMSSTPKSMDDTLGGEYVFPNNYYMPAQLVEELTT